MMNDGADMLAHTASVARVLPMCAPHMKTQDIQNLSPSSGSALWVRSSAPLDIKVSNLRIVVFA